MAKDEANDAEDKEKPEGTDGEEGAEGEGKKIKGKKLIIIIVAAVVLLAGAGAGLYFSGILGGKAEETAAAPAEGEHGEETKEGEHGEKAEKKESAAGQPVYYSLPEILVNLNTASTGKQTSFLKMAIDLELSNQSDVPIVEANLPRVMDNFNTYLRELRSSDLSGSAGIYRLREELLLRINKTLYPTQVNNILFKEIIIQ